MSFMPLIGRTIRYCRDVLARFVTIGSCTCARRSRRTRAARPAFPTSRTRIERPRDTGQAAWPYQQRCWVFTHRRLPPAPPGASAKFTREDIRTVHGQMTDAAADRNIWIMGGGELAGQFADAALLDELLVAVAPATLGAGAPLLPRRLALRLEQVNRSRDFACMRYTVVR
jgi:dihydrofolate reductase